MIACANVNVTLSCSHIFSLDLCNPSMGRLI